MIYQLFKNSAFLIIGIVFFLICFIKLDSDYGWHIKAGEMIIKHGVTTTEYFTYSMPDYPFVDFEWGSHVLMWFGDQWVGHDGLAILYAGFAVGALIICTKKMTAGYLKAAFVLLAACTLFSYVGVRVQIVSWLFFAAIVFIIQNYRNTRWFYFLPVLFFLWANVHGAFVLGLGVFGVSILVQTITRKKIVWKEWWVLLASIGSTLVNPYGLDLWSETLLIITDSHLRWTVSEWLPVIYFVKFSLWVYCGMMIAVLASFRKKIPVDQIVICVILFVSAMSSVRNVPYFILFSLFVIVSIIPSLDKELTKTKLSKIRYKKSQIVLLVLVSIVFLVEAGLEIRKSYYSSEKYYYPVKAIEFLKQNPTSGNVFTEYSWGGYMIWRNPEKKVYIDGRMSSWKVRRNGKEFKAFQEYQDVIYGKQAFIPFLKKYSVDTVVLPVRPDAYFTNWHKTLQTNAQWKKVYQDSSAVVYRKL